MAAAGNKSRIESLSDLIFGLALSISALSLIGRPVTALSEITGNLIVYLFGFLILISVWLRYTRTMEFVRVETPLATTLNVVLLFFVSVEPYLFNLVLASPSPVPGVGNLDWWLFISSLYAVDLGALFLVLGIYSVAALRVASARSSPETTLRLRAARNAHFISAAFIFASLVPAFGVWQVSLGPVLGETYARALLWFTPLVILRVQRYLVRKPKSTPPPPKRPPTVAPTDSSSAEGPAH